MSANPDWRRIEAALERYFRTTLRWDIARNKLSADIEAVDLTAETDGTPIVELNLTLLAQDLEKELNR